MGKHNKHRKEPESLEAEVARVRAECEQARIEYLRAMVKELKEENERLRGNP